MIKIYPKYIIFLAIIRIVEYLSIKFKTRRNVYSIIIIYYLVFAIII